MDYEIFYASDVPRNHDAFRNFTNRKDIKIRQIQVVGNDSPHSSIKIVVLYDHIDVKSEGER
jgi:hypothetical protein